MVSSWRYGGWYLSWLEDFFVEDIQALEDDSTICSIVRCALNLVVGTGIGEEGSQGRFLRPGLGSFTRTV
ncbi:hypothetical protein PM082_012474 [Marasmius tenuissimus]|nr:hypothetical protein PM082_012474 [Marasmius tenuissimus]